MAKRQVFFSFEFNKDAWRASQVRNMGKVDDSSTFSDNDWEEVKEKTDAKIKEWIDNQMNKRSCLVVLVGKTTSGRKWIDYEIKKLMNCKRYSRNICTWTERRRRKSDNKRQQSILPDLYWKGK